MVFFNKVDLLEEKLRNGVDVLKYIPELGSNPAYKAANFNEPLPPPEEAAEFERIVKLRKEAGLFGQIKLVITHNILQQCYGYWHRCTIPA